ncbi:phosphohistidine phosphatase SixA [Paraglaciecola aestuariivivens]
MKLIIMRHGQAESYHAQDALRELSLEGQTQATKAGEWLSLYLGKDTAVDLALVSHYTRAKQTFDCLEKHLSVLDTQASNDVVPDGRPKVAHDFIDALLTQRDNIEVLLIVSHMPFVSYFLEEVLSDKLSMLFDTSTVVVVDYNLSLGKGEIETIYHPN